MDFCGLLGFLGVNNSFLGFIEIFEVYGGSFGFFRVSWDLWVCLWFIGVPWNLLGFPRFIEIFSVYWGSLGFIRV